MPVAENSNQGCQNKDVLTCYYEQKLLKNYES